MVTVIPRRDVGFEAGQNTGEAINKAYKSYTNRADEMALQKAVSDLPANASMRDRLNAITKVRTYDPESKQTLLSNLMGVEQLEETVRAHKATEDINRGKKEAAEQKEINKKNEIAQSVDKLDLPEEQKEALKKSGVTSKDVTDIVKKQEKDKEKKEVLDKINEVRSSPGFEDLDEVGQYKALSMAGVPLADAERESKIKSAQLNRQSSELAKSYEAQSKFIDKTTSSYKEFETGTKPKLMLLSKLATDEDLIGPTANKFRENLGIPLGSLDNPASELYQKTSLDLLKGLPESYGNRILKVEVDNFLKTIPSLENSPEGRRMIASNLLKLGEMKEVFYNQMRTMQKNYLDQNKPFPKDFEQSVLDQSLPMINKLNDEFLKMSEIKNIPPGTVPFFDPKGNIKFVKKEQIEAAEKNQGRRIW